MGGGRRAIFEIGDIDAFMDVIENARAVNGLDTDNTDDGDAYGDILGMLGINEIVPQGGQRAMGIGLDAATEAEESIESIGSGSFPMTIDSTQDAAAAIAEHSEPGGASLEVATAADFPRVFLGRYLFIKTRRDHQNTF